MRSAGSSYRAGRRPFLPALFVAVLGIVALTILVRDPAGNAPATAEPSSPRTDVVSAPPTNQPTPANTPSPPEGTAAAGVPRPGVPRALRGRYWFTQSGHVGAVETTAYQRLPPEEHVLDVAEGFIASEIRPGGIQAPSVLLIRRFGSDQIVRTIETNTWVSQGVIVSGTLFWAGIQVKPRIEDPPLDGGVSAVNLGTDEPPVAVIPPGEDLTPFVGGVTVERLAFQVSPSGRSISSTIGGGGGYRSNVIDVPTLSERAVLRETVIAIADDVAIVRRGGPVSDGLPSLAAISIESGALRWSYPAPSDEMAIVDFKPSVVLDEAVAFSFSGQSEGFRKQLIVLIDLDTGRARELISWDPGETWQRLIPELSFNEQLALADAEFEDGLANDRILSISLINVQSEEWTPDVFDIELPR
jgi:hypothetical protein